MSKQLDDAQTLTQYLLGSLSAAETERLDELSVADDEVAEALKSVENDLIDAYVQDELDEAARAQFKTYYLASSMRRERVAFAQAFQAQAEKSLTSPATTAWAETATESQTEVAPGRKGRSIFSALGFDVSRRAWAWGAVVAASALVVVGAWLIFNNVRRQQQPAQTEARRNEPEQQAPEAQKESAEQRTAAAQPPDERARAERESSAQEQTRPDQQPVAEQQRAVRKPSPKGAGGIASFILVPQVRGASRMPAISIPTDADHVVIRLRLEPNEFTTYRVSLLDETGSQTLWRSSRLRARANANGKILSLSLHAHLLRSRAVYLLRVTNDAGEIVDDYPLRVMK
jgi:hypothetical protein